MLVISGTTSNPRLPIKLALIRRKTEKSISLIVPPDRSPKAQPRIPTSISLAAHSFPKRKHLRDTKGVKRRGWQERKSAQPRATDREKTEGRGKGERTRKRRAAGTHKT